jgi:hypothetical protein
MVRAILDGSKTQTRRIVKPQLSFDPNDHQGTNLSGKSSAQEAMDQVIASCPYGQPGDQLWVRETWKPDHETEGIAWYRASFGNYENGDRWHPSIHMPRWASRITLEIVSVRIERLNEITHADAIAEGCPPHPGLPTQSVCGDYERLWDSINGPGSWNANPYVWVLTFKRIKP